MVEPASRAGIGRAHGCDRPGVPHVGAGDTSRNVPRRNGRAATDPDRLPDAGPISIGPKGGQAVPHAFRQAGILFGDFGRTGACRRCRIGNRIRPKRRRHHGGRCACSPRRDISKAIPRFPGSASCAGARVRRSACCIRMTRARAIFATENMCGCSMIVARWGLCCTCATRCSLAWCWCLGSDRTKKGSRAR